MKQVLIDAGFTLHEAIIVEWQFRFSGGFQTRLIELIAKADTGNRRKLFRAFPDEVAAFTLFSGKSGWWQEVEKKYENYLLTKET